jgi:hypothetical protein
LKLRGFMIVAALALCVLPHQAAAQQSYGDGFGIGGVLLPSGSAVLLGTTRIGDSLGLEFAVELRVSDDGNDSRTNLGAGIGLKKYLTDRKQFQPFYGGRFGFLHTSRNDGHVDADDTRFGVTAVLGGEYFIIRKLSLEGEIGFDLYFGSIELGTSTRLAALFYL